MARSLPARQMLQGSGKPRINTGQSTSIRLIQPVRIVIRRGIGQRLHCGRHLGQTRRNGQLATQVVHLGQIVTQHHITLAAQRQLQSWRRDIGIAIAIATNPLPHAQEAVNALAIKRSLQIGIQLRHFPQERRFVITQRVFNFICDGQFGITQQARHPQLRHTRTQQGLIGRQLSRRQRIFGAVKKLCTCGNVVALHQQACNVVLRLQNTLALHLRRVCRQHRRHIRLRQRIGNFIGRNPRPTQARQRHFNAAFLRVARALMHCTTANVMAVFRQIGQVRKIGKRTNHTHGLVGAQPLEQLLERLVSLMVMIAAKSH